MFTAGLIGCGNIGARYDEKGPVGDVYTHAGMYTQTQGIDLKSAAEPDTDRRKAFSQFWSVPAMYADHQQMLEQEDLDIISIATPDETHQEIILDVISIRPPKLIFTEKPVSETLEGAISIYRTAKSLNLPILVDYIRRWDENTKAVKSFLKNGGLGDIQAVTSYYVRGIRHNGCQMINLLRFLLGPINAVKAFGAAGKGSFPGDPSLNIRLDFENRISANMVALDQTGYGYSIFELDILGSNGRIRFSDAGQSIEYFSTAADPQFPNFMKLKKSPSDKWTGTTYPRAMIRAGENILAYLNNGSVTLTNPIEEAIEDLIVIESAMASSRNNNKHITIEPFEETKNG